MTALHSIKTIAVAATLATTLHAQEKPNILFIFADDHAYAAINSHGNKEVKTPNLDKLTAGGTRFSHAYNSGAWNGAVCMASRAMMMTGRQVWNAHKANQNEMIANKQFFPQLMQSAGYETYFSGKWHVGSSKNCETAWVNTKNIRPGMPNQTKERYNRNWTPGKDDWSPVDPKFTGFWKGGKHWSEVLADDGKEFLKQAAKSDKPFMMMLCFNAPHDPRQAPQKYQDMYPYDSVSIPKNFLKDYPLQVGSNRIRDEKLGPFPRTHYSTKVNRSEYYALISHMDTQIGHILDALEATGKADNTIIIYSADHGLGVGQHGFLGKQNMYEHSVRAPWIISGKGIPKGKTVSQPIYIQDAMATCLDLGGVKKPEHVEFESVMPLLKGDATKARKQMYSCYISFQRMVTENKFKYILYPLIKKERLFDLENDPFELNDLAGDSKHADKLKHMRTVLDQQMKAMNDPMDLSDPEASYKAGTQRKGNKKKKGGK